jgi:RHS repeat-associated protein
VWSTSIYSQVSCELRLRRLGRLIYNYFRDYDPQLGRYVQSDPIGLNGGANTFAYARANPSMYGDPMGLVGVPADRTKNWDWISPPPLSEEECRQLRSDIYHKNELLRDELGRYNPILDGMGGWPMAWGDGRTKPGGHFGEIKRLQKGLKRDLKRYNKRCRCDNNDDGNPPISRNVDDLANEEVEPPVYPVFFILQPNYGPAIRPTVPAGGLSPALVW